MSSDNSISDWLGQLKAGDGDAAQELWSRYFDRLVRLAKQKLGADHRGASEEEDVALSAFYSFYQRASTGRIEQLDDGLDLWKVLATITIRKAYARLKYHRAAKRGGRVHSIAPAGRPDSDEGLPLGVEDMASGDLPPDMEVAISETCQQLLGKLDDDQRQIALLKMEGFTSEEIAEKLDCSVRRITRKLSLIRSKWSGEEPA